MALAATQRRDFLRHTLTGLVIAAAGMPLSACGTAPSGARTDQEPTTTPTPTRRRRILLAYFSRPGENYWNGGRREPHRGKNPGLARANNERLGSRRPHN